MLVEEPKEQDFDVDVRSKEFVKPVRRNLSGYSGGKSLHNPLRRGNDASSEQHVNSHTSHSPFPVCVLVFGAPRL